MPIVAPAECSSVELQTTGVEETARNRFEPSGHLNRPGLKCHRRGHSGPVSNLAGRIASPAKNATAGSHSASEVIAATDARRSLRVYGMRHHEKSE
jgi:hypothetical protein